MTDPTSLSQQNNATLTTNAQNKITGSALNAMFAAVIATLATMGTFAGGIYTPNIPAGSVTAAMLSPGQAASACTDNSGLLGPTKLRWICGSPVSPQMYGAAGDGVTDDTAAVTAWMQSGRSLTCSGTFKITAPINVTVAGGSSFYMQGAGLQGCKIIQAAAGAQIALTLNDNATPNGQVPMAAIRDVTFQPAAAINGPALTITALPQVERLERTVDLRNVNFTPDNDTDYAQTCLYLVDTVNVTIVGMKCAGRRAGNYLQSSFGVLISGSNVPGEIMMRDVNVYQMEYGLQLQGTWQGVSFDSGVCIDCRVGVAATSPDGNENWVRVRNSHFNVYDAGVVMSGTFYGVVSGNLVFLNKATAPSTFTDASPNNPIGISYTMSTPTGPATIISDNIIDGAQRQASGVTRTGIFIQGANGGTTDAREGGNVMQNLDVGVSIGPTANGVLTGPDVYAGVTTPKASAAPANTNYTVNPGTL